MDKTTREFYFDDPDHRNWQSHYIPKSYGGYSIVFTKAWADKYLPPTGREGGTFKLTLLDSTDGKKYATNMYVAYEDDRESVLDDDYNPVAVESLMGYFYGSHHCPCHRKADAKKAGAVVEDDECEGNRFRIYSIECDKVPGLILYSEVLNDEELENELNGN